MTREIRQADRLTEAENEKLFGWGDDIFGADDLNLRWRPKDVHFLMEVDREPVSHVGVLKHDISVGGRLLTVGGVGGVVTIAAFQKKGYARELMLHAVEFFRQWRVDAGFLFCLQRRVPYYESQGWQVIDGPVIFEQPSGKIVSPLEVMVLLLGKASWPHGEVQLNSFPW
jgi:GNAT superfamily N-acetyltransferase